MENCTAVFVDNLDEDEDEEYESSFESLKNGRIEFYSDANDTFLTRFELDLNMIGDFYENNNLSDDTKKAMFKTFAENIQSDDNCEIKFKQTNGEILIKKIGDIVSFVVTGECYGCEFNVKLNMSVINVFNKIAQ